jgi:Zn-dependent protease with chaperone function
MQIWAIQQGGLVADARQARAQALTQNLRAACQGVPITIHVLNSDNPCAFSWPSGHIFVTCGLMDMLNDDELSAAIAHEMGHLLNDGHLQTISTLQSTCVNPDREARADAAGVALLRARGIPAAAMAHMLQKVKASPLVPPPCQIALQRRIVLLALR